MVLIACVVEASEILNVLATVRDLLILAYTLLLHTMPRATSIYHLPSYYAHLRLNMTSKIQIVFFETVFWRDQPNRDRE